MISGWWNFITRLLRFDLGCDQVQVPPIDLGDDDNDDCEDGAEIVASAQEGFAADDILSMLRKNPRLIRLADPVGNSVIHISARDGDIVTVCKLITFLKETGDKDLKRVLVDVNFNGDTPLHLAIKNGHRQVSHHLVKAERWAGIVRNSAGITAFELAEQSGYHEVLSHQYFFASGDVDLEMRAIMNDLRNARRAVPVHWDELKSTIDKGEEGVLVTGLTRHGKELLRHQDSLEETLLHAAVKASGMRPLTELVQFMISNGMTDAAFLKDVFGYTPLHRAVANEQLRKARCLIKAAPGTVYVVNRQGISPLYETIRDNHRDLIKYMVTQSSRTAHAPQMLQHKNATLTHLTMKTKSFGTLKLLTAHLPELVNATDERGWRPLSYAANKGYLDEVTYFLTDFPKSAEKCDKDGTFPIHKAVGGGHVSIIEAFLKHCPQTLQHVDRKGRSVLHIAAIYDKTEIITYLTEKVKLNDSFLNLRDNSGKTFTDYAKALVF